MLSTTLALALAAPQVPDLKHLSQGLQPEAPSGTALAVVGDWNGDGVADYVVGIPDYDQAPSPFVPDGTDLGAAQIRSGLDGSILVTYAPSPFPSGGTPPPPRVGAAVAGGFDTNANGSPEFAIGAPGIARVQLLEDALFGGLLGIVATFDGEQSLTLDEEGFGTVVENLGDLTGDGRPELGIGSPSANALFPDPFGGPPITIADSGSVKVFDGATHALVAEYAFFTGNERLGASMVGIADITGDGRRDLAVGAPGSGGTGVVYLLDASTSGPSAVVATLSGTTSGERFGSSLANLGDLDGGGRDELLVGAGGFAVGVPPFQLPRGRVAVIDGESLGELWSRTGKSVGTLGESVAAVDLDGDGLRSALVIDGSTLFPTLTAVRALDGLSGAEQFAWDAWPASRDADLTGGFDVDADGGGDFLVGLPELDFQAGGQLCCGLYLGPPIPGGSNSLWTVDDDGPADFDSIAAAALVVASGDTLLVEEGSYDTAVIQRSLNVLGDIAPALDPSVTSIAIDGAPVVRLSHLRLGSLWVEGVSGRAALGSLTINGALPTRIVDCENVLFSTSNLSSSVDSQLSIDGPTALEVVDSDVQLVNSVVRAASGQELDADGGHGIELFGTSRLWSLGTWIFGGNGANGAPEFFIPGGNGGDAIVVHDGAFADVRARSSEPIRGGTKGVNDLGTGLTDGVGIATDASGQARLSKHLAPLVTTSGPGVTIAPNSTPALEFPNTWRIGFSGLTGFSGEAGAIYVLLFSLGGAEVELPNVLGTPVWIDLAQLNQPVPAVVGNLIGPDTLQVDQFSVPNVTNLIGFEFFLQGLVFDPVTGLFEGSTGGGVMLDD